MEKVEEDDYKLHSNLTIKGIRKLVVLDIEYGGTAKDRFGNTKAGFTLNTRINRHDFGVGTLNPGLGDEVKLYSSIQVTKQV